jgi:GH15 family glucan-1,4-alpha-glucosidase
MLEDISLLDMRQLFSNHISNPVYRSAAMHLKHTACPVPGAILKAAEVALGLCVPEDVTISFIKE